MNSQEHVDGRVVICGPMRNGSQYIDGVRSNMEKIGAYFDDYRIIIVESDSDDDSLVQLERWQTENSKMEYVSLGHTRHTQPMRTMRLANARNKCLDIINEKYSDYNYMVMMDPDDITYHPIEGFLTCWDTSVGDDWDGMTANQKEEYYDIWALRGMDCNYDCWVRGFIEGLPSDEIKRRYVDPHTKPIPPGDPILVNSAFGGLGVYKMESIRGCRYVGNQFVGGKEYEIADHVKFHEQMREKGGKIYINTTLFTNNKPQLVDRSSDMLPYITPYKCYNLNGEEYTKKRIGRANDGGYVIPIEIVDESEILYSYGISNDVSFDLDFVRHKEVMVHMYDHTIDKLPYEHHTFKFHKEGVASTQMHNLDTFNNQVATNGDNDKKLFVKMDIEGAEWNVINTMNMDNIVCLVLEIHWLDKLEKHGIYIDTLKILHEHFILFHIHGNNYVPPYGTHKIPSVLEMTYINRKYISRYIVDNGIYPTIYDAPNNPSQDDLPIPTTIQIDTKQIDIDQWKRKISTIRDEPFSYLEVNPSNPNTMLWMLSYMLRNKGSRAYSLDLQNVMTTTEDLRLTVYNSIDEIKDKKYKVVYISSNPDMLELAYEHTEEGGLLIIDTTDNKSEMRHHSIVMISGKGDAITLLHLGKQFFIFKH